MGMKTAALRNRSLHPLSTRARALSSKCDTLWVASAFVSDNAIADVVETALDAGASVRFLTGTFGRVTRLRTFRRLLLLSQKHSAQVRIWEGDFHAKAYLWQRGRSVTCWVGSANLTDRGLQADGELMLEVVTSSSAEPIKSIRKAFDAEWRLARDLDTAFVRTYRESERAGPLLRAPRSKPRTLRGKRNGKLAVVVTRDYFPPESEIAQRVEALLGGTANDWCRTFNTSHARLKPGAPFVLADSKANELGIYVVTDTARDGRALVFSYEPFVKGTERKVTRRELQQLKRVGVAVTARTLRGQWLSVERAIAFADAFYSARTRNKLESILRGRLG